VQLPVHLPHLGGGGVGGGGEGGGGLGGGGLQGGCQCGRLHGDPGGGHAWWQQLTLEGEGWAGAVRAGEGQGEKGRAAAVEGVGQGCRGRQPVSMPAAHHLVAAELAQSMRITTRCLDASCLENLLLHLRLTLVVAGPAVAGVGSEAERREGVARGRQVGRHCIRGQGCSLLACEGVSALRFSDLLLRQMRYNDAVGFK
jgi:hypothetical protein